MAFSGECTVCGYGYTNYYDGITVCNNCDSSRIEKLPKNSKYFVMHDEYITHRFKNLSSLTGAIKNSLLQKGDRVVNTSPKVFVDATDKNLCCKTVNHLLSVELAYSIEGEYYLVRRR